nr:MAG: ORF1 [TTV-like mini virus]
MPYYRRPWYRRRRRIWRRRARTTFRRRRYWRRRYWVRNRKKKLKKVILKEWQPTKINRLKIKGKYPLFEGTSDRLPNNNTQYIDAVAPYLIPGGGLFSITVFTLQGLYELHTKARNWWTKTNCQLPLIKYLGCKIFLYRSLEVDYVTVYARCGSLTATQQLYNSTQPSVLALNLHKKIVTCKKYNKHRKPYRVIKVPPPSLMTNKWYFQQDIKDIPLVMLLTSAASFDRYYTASSSISSTLGFTSINTDTFQYHNWKKPPSTTPYKPNDDFWLYSWSGTTVAYENATFQHIVLLGNTKDYQMGSSPTYTTATDQWNNNVNTYFSTPKLWGNPFHDTYLHNWYELVLITNKTINEVKLQATTTPTGKLKDHGFTQITKPALDYCRYNPQADTSHNAVFLSRLTTDNTKWHEEKDPKLSNSGLPLWILLWGWHDWLRKANYAQNLDTDYVFTIISDHISPKRNFYVPIDTFFEQGKSPFEHEKIIRPFDLINWHPKYSFQTQSIAHICNTGPGTPKLQPNVSVEGHLSYIFYFKLGGCPPPMDDVCDPAKQPKFATPSNILSSTLLQNPEHPMQYYLQSFDQRRDTITERAAKRLRTDFSTKTDIFQPTGQTAMDIKAQTIETSTTETSSDEEESEKTLQRQLKHQHRQQRKLRDRILQLLKLIPE